MATHRVDLYSMTNNTLSKFTSFGNGIRTALSALGWAMTTDTGQVDWDTLAALPSNDATTVYEIWKMTDTLADASPVYLKIVYKTGVNGAAYVHNLDMYLGNGSDGAGTLLNATQIVASNNSSNANLGTYNDNNLYDCLFSGTTSSIQMMLWRNNNSPFFLSIERSRDANGDETASHVIAVVVKASWNIMAPSYTSTQKNNYYYNPATGTALSDAYVPTVPCTPDTTALAGYISIFPLSFALGGLQNPMMGCIGAKFADWTDQDVVSISLYPSVPHNYIALNGSNTAKIQRSFGSVGENNAILMRWD